MRAVFSHRAVCGVDILGWPCVDAREFSFTLVIAGLIGLSGLALVMGTALSSLAELLALLVRPDGSARPPGARVLPLGIGRPYGRALLHAVLAWHDGTGGFTHRSDGKEVQARAR